MRKTKLQAVLAYAGALPFIAMALLWQLGVERLPLLGEVRWVSASYGLVIVSFLCGILWGVALQPDEPEKTTLFLLSNLVTLTVWFAFLLMSPAITLLQCAAAFLLLLAVDYHRYRHERITPDYWQLRRNVTALVVVSLFASV